MLMPTTKKRTNLCLPNDIDEALVFLAERDDVPKATKALQLIKIAIAVEEDEVWDSLATKRDTKDAKFISHKDAWL